MQGKTAVLRMMLMVGLLVGTLAGPGIAAQDDMKEVMLPRSFQGARLGMTVSELVAVVPDANRVSLNRREQAQRTVIIPSKDRYLQRVEYRFYNDRLRELAIHYTYGEVPGGYKRLRQRLQEANGKPTAVDEIDHDAGLNIVSVKKTVWKDLATMARLTESRKIIDDRRELVLTITDLNLQQAFEEDQEHRRRQRELSIPIPLSDHSIQNRQAGISGSENAPNGHARG
ncbi:MAG TPA: hypothetical protein VF078_00945 [Nitrospira sp.]